MFISHMNKKMQSKITHCFIYWHFFSYEIHLWTFLKICRSICQHVFILLKVPFSFWRRQQWSCFPINSYYMALKIWTVLYLSSNPISTKKIAAVLNHPLFQLLPRFCFRDAPMNFFCFRKSLENRSFCQSRMLNCTCFAICFSFNFLP